MPGEFCNQYDVGSRANQVRDERVTQHMARQPLKSRVSRDPFDDMADSPNRQAGTETREPQRIGNDPF